MHVPIQSAELAKAQVLEGNLWGYFTFPSNYSQHMANLVVEQKFAGNETLEGSRVRLRMDMSSYLGAAIALRTTFEAYENFAKNLAISCGLNEKEFQLPIMYREPVYGTNEASYHDYVTPIVILTVIFEVPMLITTILFISDKKQGTLDRARIAGLKFKEGLIGYILTQGSVAVGQTFICYVVMKVIYDFHVLGSLFAFFFILILGGICGLSMGLLMGIVFKDEIGALMMGMLIGPTIILWESGRKFTNSGAMSSPTTMVCASLRSVISRGWGLFHPQVWPGIAVLGGYTVFFWVISIWLYIRKYK
ncbi:ABC transporter G family member 23 [Orchesella cincta]|uniref:ABC transporter G family member 23 n=1 Tax=Orchesella cincta TaxID=48709 RepID=A0A1D2NGH3_ORCCI|nr:ABC transporter G family member 23 [Orchesella cincta]